MAEVEEQSEAGLLPWTYTTVQPLITPHPRRGHLDEIKIGQEDEATPDLDGVPWEDEEDEKEKAEAANAGDDAEEEEEVLDFDPDDWTDPQAAARQNGARDADVPRHGDGDDQIRKASLNEEQADSVLGHSARLRSLKRAPDTVSYTHLTLPTILRV